MSNGVCLSHGGTNAQLDVACIASTLAGAWSADATQSTVIVVKEYLLRKICLWIGKVTGSTETFGGVRYGLKLCESAFDARLAVEGFGQTSSGCPGKFCDCSRPATGP